MPPSDVEPPMARLGAGEEPHDFAKLASYLEALASPARLELLHLLRHPRSAADIQLRASDPQRLNPDRNLTREGVRKHLARLEDAGFVVAQRVRREGGQVKEHMVNHQVVFAVVEELRRVSRVDPTVAPPLAATFTGAAGEQPPEAAGPRLLVVNGAREGVCFPLRADGLRPGRGWVVGRKRGLPACLDYDPFVSQEHAEIVLRGDGFELLDLRSNKNGTELNWRQIPRGASAPVRHGDLVGVGRSLLLFWER